MKIFKRGLAVVAVVAASAGMAATASANITPSPYSFSGSDRIAFVTNTALGTGRCDVTGVAGTITNNAGRTGFSGSITAGTVTNCSGPIRSGAILFPVTITGTLNGNGTSNVSAVVGILIVNTVGGHCLYRGTLTNAAVRGNAFTLSNPAIALVSRLSSSTPIFGICSNPADANLTVSLGGASIS